MKNSSNLTTIICYINLLLLSLSSLAAIYLLDNRDLMIGFMTLFGFIAGFFSSIVAIPYTLKHLLGQRASGKAVNQSKTVLSLAIILVNIVAIYMAFFSGVL